MAKRRLNSSLWVWYPRRLSRTKSFHHKKVIRIVRKAENLKSRIDNLKLIYITVLDKVENKLRDKRRGHRED